jgi:DNA-binding GntR family transcriptional regulator
MSQNSKVAAAVRQAILTFLAPGTTATNNGLKKHVLPTTSLRSVQEATQKLTAEGLLTSSRSKGKTWYGIATTEVFPGLENTSVSVPVV